MTGVQTCALPISVRTAPFLFFNMKFFNSASHSAVKSVNLGNNASDVHHMFNLTPFTVAEVHKALKHLNPRKPSGPDHLEPRFLKLAADLIAEPLTHLFNLSLASNKIPMIWKAAYVLPLLKGGDPNILNNYRPLSNLSVLSKVMESLVSEQVKDYVHTHQKIGRAHV